MNNRFTRLPSVPLIVNDPFFSVWCPADTLTGADSVHWSEEKKALKGTARIDGRACRFLGLGKEDAMETTSLTVTPTATESTLTSGGVSLTVRFTTPLLMDRPDILSMPVTYVDIEAESTDGQEHSVSLKFFMPDSLCVQGTRKKPMFRNAYAADRMQIAFAGQLQQNLLGHSGDRVTIDWGYMYLAAKKGVSAVRGGLSAAASGKVRPGKKVSLNVLAAYDDIASINYFGKICPAYYARGGLTIRDALRTFRDEEKEIKSACRALDEQILKDAYEMGGEDYQLIASAAYRQTIGAHKLIADGEGHLIFLSKENDSCGSVGTVDVSYPSMPLFLLYNPEFVRGMCRPVLKFASLPVWHHDFAPHDVGRYPHATGQWCILKTDFSNGIAQEPTYLYPADDKNYAQKGQMPVEECGNMLIMLCAAAHADGNYDLIREYEPTLEKWARYLIEHGEDPGEQLCTDDFAGHLAHNVNLSAKAVMGVAAYALIQRGLGNEEAHDQYMAKAREMAESWLSRADAGGYTYLSFDKQGWSMKYNLVWDRLLNLRLLDDSFYRQETESYLPRMNEFGLPLDSRKDYTKSDWVLWTASMAEAPVFRQIIAPVARYLRESNKRVPFGDFYDTKIGDSLYMFARSVQGGVFMPLLMRAWHRS